MAFINTLYNLWPNGDSVVAGLRDGIAKAAPVVFPKYGITTSLLVAHVMGQFSEETGEGHDMVENIHYSAGRAVQVWPSRFHSAADCYQKVGSFPGDPAFPIKLMDSVYGTRMGNRPGTHDGSTFIGRGLSQLTGRSNYDLLSRALGVMPKNYQLLINDQRNLHPDDFAAKYPVFLDLLSHPELLISPDHALECGVADFLLCGCLRYAEADDVVGVTIHLNGGKIGLAERQTQVSKWKHALGDLSKAPDYAIPQSATQK